VWNIPHQEVPEENPRIALICILNVKERKRDPVRLDTGGRLVRA
jgi:hypothetical protein